MESGTHTSASTGTTARRPWSKTEHHPERRRHPRRWLRRWLSKSMHTPGRVAARSGVGSQRNLVRHDMEGRARTSRNTTWGLAPSPSACALPRVCLGVASGLVALQLSHHVGHWR
jgi:hypothetical protein